MITFSLYTDRIDSALKLYASVRKDKSYPYILNRTCRNVAMRAAKNTPPADRGRIAQQMGQTVTVSTIVKRGKRAGQRKIRRFFEFEGSLAARIVNKRRRDNGQPMLFGKEMNEAARRMVAARMRSVGFLKSGYIPAIKAFSRATKVPANWEGHIKGQPKGYADLAKRGVMTHAELGNNAKGVAHVSGPGLQAALHFVATDMVNFALKELKKRAEECGFEVR